VTSFQIQARHRQKRKAKSLTKRFLKSGSQWRKNMAIRSKPTNDNYRNGFERTFRKKSKFDDRHRKTTSQNKRKSKKKISNPIQKELDGIKGKAQELSDFIETITNDIQIIVKGFISLERKVIRMEEQGNVPIARRVINLEREFEKLQITKTLEKAMEKAYPGKEKL